MRPATVYTKRGYETRFPLDTDINFPCYGTSNYVASDVTSFENTTEFFGSKLTKENQWAKLIFNVKGKASLDIIGYAIGCSRTEKGLPFSIKPHGAFTECETAFCGSLSAISKLLKKWHKLGYEPRTTRVIFMDANNGSTHEYKVKDVSGNTSTTHELQEVRASLPPID